MSVVDDALLRGSTAEAPSWEPPAADPVDQAALDDFVLRYGDTRLAPVTVLIPAFQEAENIATVIARVPETVLGMNVDVVVVTDGCTDATAPIARRAGAYVCEARVNRGQGAAYRLGYRLVGALGARYVATIDADGQYDPADIPALLEPIVCGEADIVHGSRVLGVAERDDRFRLAGVYFFAVVISLLLGRKVTDSSNGLRIMRVAVPTTVRLVEDQYQSSEMLIGAVRCGFRYAERPVTVAKRLSGSSKKAPNLLYGLHYLRVVLRTRFRRQCRIDQAKPILTVLGSPALIRE